MRPLKKVAWSLVAATAVGLAVGACGGEANPQDPAAAPAPSGDVHPDLIDYGCVGAGCPCSASQPCLQKGTFCSDPSGGRCEVPDPCGNCNPAGTGTRPIGVGTGG
jgi:hypothetical protein